MAININDGFLVRAPKPTDMKMFVGDGDRMLYDTKEDIPDSMRFEGMVVYESIAGVYNQWRLEGGEEDTNWTQMVAPIRKVYRGTGASIVDLSPATIHPEVIVSLNGSELAPGTYSFSPSESTITFEIPVTISDVYSISNIES